MPEYSVYCKDHSKNSVDQTQVVIEIHVNRAIQRVDYGEKDSVAATATVPLGVTISHEELPTVVKLFPIKYDDLLSSDMVGNCDLTSIFSTIEDFVPGSILKILALDGLDDCKKKVTEFFMKHPSLRADGEGKPSLLSVVVPVQVIKVIETFDHYDGDDVKDGHSHNSVDVKYLQTPEMDQFLSRRCSSFFSLLTMKKFDGANDSAGECSICLQDYDEKNDGDNISLVELACTHVFHTRCVISSLDAKTRCPGCRCRFPVQPLPKCSCHASSVHGENSLKPFIEFYV